MALCILATVWVFIHDIIDKIINLIFAYLYDGKKKPIPAITDPILMKSATALAKAIRKREVSQSCLYFCLIYIKFLHLNQAICFWTLNSMIKLFHCFIYSAYVSRCGTSICQANSRCEWNS